MLPDRSQLYLERIVYHRRFFFPSAICLFLAYPGSLAALLPSDAIHLTTAQRIETLLLYVPTALAYWCLLIWAVPRQSKVLLGVLTIALPIVLTTLLIRTSVFSVNFHQAALRWEVIVHFLPGLAMFFILCLMDQKKRARSIFWSLILLTIPLGIYSAKTTETVRFLDKLRLEDISDRLAQREPLSEFMTEQCNLISDSNWQLKCHAALIAATGNDMNCEETGGINDCVLSRREHVEKKLSGHPTPSAPTQEPKH